MTLYALSPDRAVLGVVTDIKSLQWVVEYQDAGSVKLVCNISDGNRALLRRGNLLYNIDDDRLCLIEDYQIDDDKKSATLTVWGALTACRISQRCVVGTANVTNAEAGMLGLVQANLHGLPLIVAAAQGYTEDVTGTAVTDTEVQDGVQTIAKASGLGYKVTYDFDTATETFCVLRGTDRTQGSDSYVGYFGDDIGNVAKIKIKAADSGSKNVAIVLGEGEGTNRKVVIVGDATGADRREMVVNAASTKRTYQVTNADGTYTQATYTEAEYESVLTGKGLKALAKNAPELDISAEVLEGVLRWRTDYDVGDVMPLKLTRYGILCEARVAAVKLIYETAGNRKVVAALNNITIKGGNL
ncbi:MAG: hypothetical protein RSD27_10300 [Ruthenibacterium sp.]